MNAIPLPNPARQRQTPPRFSWIDHRLLRDGHLAACASPDALALYLMLTTAADARGLSYYSDKRLCAVLSVSLIRLREARRCLVKNDLIAWRKPHYQVLCLDPESIRQARLRDPAAAEKNKRTNQTMSLQEVLQRLSQSASSHD